MGATTNDDGGHAATGACLNCGTARIGEHCHACGQSSHVHRSMGAIGHELAHGAFHFEGRIWRTLPLLAWQPGALTRRYIDGERMRFVSPLALFLFIVFVLFTLLSIIGVHLEAPHVDPAASRDARTRIEARLADDARQTATLTQQRARTTDPAAIERLDRRIAKVASETSANRLALDAVEGDTLQGLSQIRTGWHRLDDGIAKATENPNLILYKLQSNAYKFAWALIPLSLPFMWLLFPFSRRYGMYDHAVFVTYSLCFMLLLVLALSVIAQLPIGGALYGLAIVAALVWAPVHLYKQLRGTYGCGRFGALVRTVLLFVLATIVITCFALLLVTLGLVG